jgi:cobalt/nickel transport system permease protein
MGVAAAGVFAAQMINFPLPFVPASGHVMGGVLAAALLGPWAGIIVIAVVLVVQALLFGDGGLDALGANIVNLGVIGAGVGYCVLSAIRRGITGRAGIAAATVIAAWFSVLLAAACLSLELAFSGFSPLPTISTVLFVHLFVGLGEAVISGLSIAFVLRTRPDLVESQQRTAPRPAAMIEVVLGGLAVALTAAIFCSPLASELPDGLEWAKAQLEISSAEAPPWFRALIPDYQFPALVEHAVAATSVGGLIGTLIVFGIAWSIGRSLRFALGRNDHAS